MIILNHLSKNYVSKQGVTPALDDINLSIKPGEIFGVIGKSGAGKSTLIRCINLLETPSRGEVIVNGQDLLKLPAAKLRQARQKIGMIFQHFNLLSSRTIYENVALPLELSGHEAKDSVIMPLLELTGLSHKKNNYPAQLSGGQKQRVGIARALACQPHVLLCDEATSALDPETTQSILQLLINIRDTLNLTILLITHEMSVIKTCCDRVGVLEQGKLIEENEVGEFFAYPKTVTAQSFIFSSLPHTLPPAIQQFISMHPGEATHPVLRLLFMPDTATQPVIAQLMTRFHLKINILQGNVEYIKKHAMGILFIAVEGERAQFESGLQHLKNIGVNVEIIGHVPNDIISFS